MLRLPLLLCLCLSAAAPALAQGLSGGMGVDAVRRATPGPPAAGTTFTTDCYLAGVTITGLGLTLTATNTNTTWKPCRGTSGKYAGKVYFEYTPSNTSNSNFIGVGAGPTVVGTTSTAGENPGVAGGTKFDAGIYNYFGSWSLSWNNLSSAMPAMTNAKASGFAYNLDTDSPQYWISTDVTASGLICNGAGAAGTTNPRWNSSAAAGSGGCAADPSIPGSGHPVSGGTGKQFFIPSYGVYPFWQGKQNDAGTFNFGGAAFAWAQAGFTAWDSAPASGPPAPVTINVANAPGYQTTHTYTNPGGGTMQRVVAGPGWNGSAYTSGSKLCLFALTAGSGSASGSDATIFNTACNSGAPAGVGGGLLGSAPAGWGSAATVADGSLTWTLLSSVDYVSLTGMQGDAPAWQASTGYKVGDFVVNGGNSYRETGAGFSFASPCTSAGSGGPTGTTLYSNITDGGCTWQYQGSVAYSSQVNRWPHQQSWDGSATHWWLSYNNSFTINVWCGTRSNKCEYEGGANGETDPILVQWHQDFLGDYNATCYLTGGTGVLANSMTTSSNGGSVLCQGGNNNTNTWTFRVPAGDSLFDNVTSGAGPLRIDHAKGVVLYSSTTWTGGQPWPGVALGLGDAVGFFNGFQFDAPSGMCFAGHVNGPGGVHTNFISFDRFICNSGSGNGAIWLDASNTYKNGVITMASTTANAAAIHSGYSSQIWDTTIVCAANGTNSIGIETGSAAIGWFPAVSAADTPIQANVTILGCATPVGNGVAWASTSRSQNNVVSNASGVSGTYTSIAGGTFTKLDMPGTTVFSVTPSNQLVNPTIGGSFDARVKNSSADIYGAGAALPAFSVLTTTPIGTPSLTPDIFGNARPTSGRYDVGAAQLN